MRCQCGPSEKRIPADVPWTPFAYSSLGCSGIVLYSNGDDGLIVESLDAGGMVRYRREDGVHNLLRRVRGAADNLFNAATSEKFSCLVGGVENAVTEKDEQVAGFGAEAELF